MHLPLHIFEPRYRAMVSDALARDRRIGMIQPRERRRAGRRCSTSAASAGSPRSRRSTTGGSTSCWRAWRASASLRELDVTTPFRQVEADARAAPARRVARARSSAPRSRCESRRFADAQGYAVDWEAVARLDDESLVNGIAQIAPFDAASKQALLEAPTLAERAELIVQLMQFYGRRDEAGSATLQ